MLRILLSLLFRNLSTICGRFLSISFIHSNLSNWRERIIFLNFVQMNERKYFSIGSDPNNDLQLVASDINPFQLLLYRNEAGQVFVSARSSGASFQINDEEHTALYSLQAQDKLALAGHFIDWKAIYDISQEEIQEVEQTQTKVFETEKQLKIQLILIYTAIAALLLLMAFYI